MRHQQATEAPSGPRAYTIDDVAAMLTVSTRHLRRLIRAGKLPAKRIGARVVILAKDLDAYLQQLPSA